MEHLLSVWPEIAQQFKDARHILLLLDYDGTLTPIAESPEKAILPEEVRSLLEALLHQPRFTIGIISGRALSDLKNKVNLDNIIYAGNHGLEIEGPGLRFVNPLAQEMKPILRMMHRVLTRTLGTVKGVFVENKELSLSVHYRQVEEAKAGEVKQAVDHVVGGLHAAGNVKVTNGKKVYEVRPAVNWDKGKAIKLLMKKYGKGGRESKLLPIYIGDDLTDEDGFKIIAKYGNGISTLVGNPRQDTAARYYLESPAEVTEFLNRLLKYVQQD